MKFWDWRKTQPYRRDASTDYGMQVWAAAQADMRERCAQRTHSLLAMGIKRELIPQKLREEPIE